LAYSKVTKKYFHTTVPRSALEESLSKSLCQLDEEVLKEVALAILEEFRKIGRRTGENVIPS
jgi:hypothetical protein